MKQSHDVIVVGARCAGSPLGMLLARKGYDVLIVDRATFPSDTMSTLMIHPQGVAALERWGVLDDVIATGCPPIARYSFDFGPVTLTGSPAREGTAPVSYAPKRTVLDKILVDAAREAGAEVREGFTVEDVLVEDGAVVGIRGHDRDSASTDLRARFVVGADGRHSLVAKAVQPEQYNETPPLGCNYYTYWSGLPVGEMEIHIRTEQDRGFALIPTNDDLTLLVMGWPRAEFEANRGDIEGNYLKTLELVPEVAARVKQAKREARFVGAADLAGFFRKPYGPGWALVGDAGYHKDPITAQGISDAFIGAEKVCTAIDGSLSDVRDFDDAMSEYQAQRDARAMPHYGFTAQLASLETPPIEMLQLFGAMAGNQDAMNDFAAVYANTLSPAEFFTPDNIGRIMESSGSVPAVTG